MLRIERSVRGALAVFAVSGRVGVKNLAELERIVESEAAQRKVLNLRDLTLVDRHAVGISRTVRGRGYPARELSDLCPAVDREGRTPMQLVRTFSKGVRHENDA